MRYINQLDYRHVPYRTKVKLDEISEDKKMTNIASSGCGLCSVCMIIELLTDTSVSVEECVKISEECVANHSTGTDMNVLGPVIAEKFGIHYSKTSELTAAIHHLQSGGMMVVHVGVPEGKEIGLFTKGGHYMAVISTDGEKFCFLDPSYTPEKFTVPERAGKVNTTHAPFLYCDVNTLDRETKPGKVKYHLFSRKTG